MTKRFDEIRKAEEIGSLVLDMMKKIQMEGSKRTSLGIKLPEPSTLPEVRSRSLEDPANLTVADAARILETSQDTVRRLVEDGSLKCSTTRGGHRRFRASQIESYSQLVSKADHRPAQSTISETVSHTEFHSPLQVPTLFR